MDEHLFQRELRERIVEALRVDPPAVPLRPARLSVAIDPAMAQQLLEHPVTGGRARAADVVAAAQHVTQPFGLDRRRLYQAQQSRAMQADQLLRVTAIGLDPVAG